MKKDVQKEICWRSAQISVFFEVFTFSIIAFLSSEFLLYSFNKEIKFFLKYRLAVFGIFLWCRFSQN